MKEIKRERKGAKGIVASNYVRGMFGIGTRGIGDWELGVRGYELRVAEGDWKWEFGIASRDKGLDCGERQ